ncbi:MAG: tudor domain-containing protein, partial [Gemmatimonadota bacterium]|nr:tudor domain-containing protein [Gemmatimonadota bacterium]
MRLTDDEFRDVLTRAEEIQRASRHDNEMNAEIEAVIGAAEEVGLARPAVERALRERLALSVPPAVGALTFARSTDDKFYVAEVVSISTEGVRVRFLRGGEHLVTLDELKPCAFLPGERVVCNWPWWGPWTCT